MTGGRRVARQRVDPAAEAKAWGMTFRSGFNYIRALPRIGVAIDGSHRADPELVADAWRRLGAAHIEQAKPDAPCWALATCGPPDQMPMPRRRR